MCVTIETSLRLGTLLLTATRWREKVNKGKGNGLMLLLMILIRLEEVTSRNVAVVDLATVIDLLYLVAVQQHSLERIVPVSSIRRTSTTAVVLRWMTLAGEVGFGAAVSLPWYCRGDVSKWNVSLMRCLNGLDTLGIGRRSVVAFSVWSFFSSSNVWYLVT